MSTIDQIKLINLPHHTSDNGHLIFAEQNNPLPFEIKRLFTVVDIPQNAVRGRHAHHQCQQFFMCTQGSATILCDDSQTQQKFNLDNPHTGMIVPPLIWVTLTFHSHTNSLTALTDRPYEEQDYIRNYDDFLKIKKKT